MITEQKNGQAVTTQDEADIQAITQSLMDGWNSGDGDLFATHFAEDADYMVWNGSYIKGKEAIAEGHSHLFSTAYKDTKMKLEIVQIRFLSDGVATVHLQGGVLLEERKWPSVKPLLVLTRHNGAWMIDVFQNTPIVFKMEGVLEN
ncbi:MAG: SgcJ/EcaC family oxidoreductase [Candidatus Promineifilaceae bacterium]